MRRWLVLTVAALFLMGVGTAFADVDVTATIDKDKDITIAEYVFKLKLVVLVPYVLLDAEKAAESEALINQTNNKNRACENCAEKRDKILGSVNNNTGIVTVNQAAGNMNNQGSAVAVSVDAGGDSTSTGPPPDIALLPPRPPVPPRFSKGGFAEAQAAVDQKNGGLKDRSIDVGLGNVVNSINILFREALIQDSVNDNTGIVLVNQSVGQMNNQANAVSVAVSLRGGVAMAESDLGQVNAYNRVDEFNVTKTATISNSVNHNTGIVGVNQAAGNMANQANVVSVAAAIGR